MTSHMTPTQKKLWRRFDEVLYYLWDPIGVSDSPEAREEYETYLPKIFGLVVEQKPRAEIERHLAQIVIERMGLRNNKEKNLEVIAILEKWRDILKEQEA